MTEEKDTNEFINLMTEFQGPLYAYILSITGHADDANDILQETNMTLWNKSGEFTLGTSFKAWSFRVANFKVMSYRKRQRSNKLVFDDELSLQLSNEIQASCTTYNKELELLRSCINKLNDRHKDLILKRYTEGYSVKVLADFLKMPANSVAQVIHRARLALSNCVEKKLKEQNGY